MHYEGVNDENTVIDYYAYLPDTFKFQDSSLDSRKR